MLPFVMVLVTFHILLMKKLHTGVESIRRANWQQRVETLNGLSTPMKLSQLHNESNAHHGAP